MRYAKVLCVLCCLLTVAPLAADPVTPGDFGAAGDGVANDQPALQAALNTGKVVHLEGGTYRITSRVDVPADGGIVGPGVIVHDFNITLPPDDPSSLDVAVRVIGDNVELSGFKLRKVFTDGSYSNGIVVDNRKDFRFRGLDISGYSARYGIHIIESTDFEVSGCYIHDFMMDTTADMIADSPAGLRITRSHRGLVNGNRILRIENGPTGRASISPIRPDYGPQGYQSDCITAAQCTGLTFTGNMLLTSGEGLDLLLSNNCTVAGNVISDIWFQGVKMLGVSFCSINGNYFADCYQGVGMVYHGVFDAAASGNTVSGNVFRDMGSPGSFGVPGPGRVGFSSVCGVLIHGEGDCRYNVVSDNMIADTQATKTMAVGIINDGGPTNLVTDNIVTNAMTYE